MMHRIYCNAMAELQRHHPLEVIFANIVCISWRMNKISYLMMTKQNRRRLCLGKAPGLPNPVFHPSWCQGLLGSQPVAINYLVAALLISLTDATIPEAMAELAVPCASEGAVAGW